MGVHVGTDSTRAKEETWLEQWPIGKLPSRQALVSESWIPPKLFKSTKRLQSDATLIRKFRRFLSCKCVGKHYINHVFFWGVLFQICPATKIQTGTSALIWDQPVTSCRLRMSSTKISRPGIIHDFWKTGQWNFCSSEIRVLAGKGTVLTVFLEELYTYSLGSAQFALFSSHI